MGDSLGDTGAPDWNCGTRHARGGHGNLQRERTVDALRLVAKVDGQEHVGSALGRVMVRVTSFNFLAAPVARMLFDETGSQSMVTCLTRALNGIALARLLAPGARVQPDRAGT